MANPFSALGSVPIMQVIQDTMQRSANIARTNAGTQLVNQQSQLLGQQIESERKFNEGLAQLANARQAKETSEAGLPPDFAAFGNTTIGKPIMDGYKAETQSAQQNRQLAQVAITAGDFSRSKQFEQQATAADNRAREWYAQGLQLAKQQHGELASVASTYADDGSNVQDVVNGISAIDPRKLQGAQFDRDGQGNIVAGPRTAKAFSTIADQSMTRSEQLTNQREKDKLQQQAIDNARKAREDSVRDKRTDAMIAHMQHMEVMAEKRFAASQTPEVTDSDPGTAAMIASGMPLAQAVPGFGKQAVAERKARRNEALQQIMDETGMDKVAAGQELANRQIGYFAGRRSTTQLTTMLGATEQAINQLDFNRAKVTEEMKKLPSTDLSPLLNAMIRGEERWTGDPAYASLYFYMHAAAMESARILQGGQASIAQLHQGAAEEAKHWADIGLTPKMWESVSKAMGDEGRARLKTYQDAIQSQKIGAGHIAESRGVPSMPKVGEVVKGYKYKGGDPSKPESWEQQ